MKNYLDQIKNRMYSFFIISRRFERAFTAQFHSAKRLIKRLNILRRDTEFMVILSVHIRSKQFFLSLYICKKRWFFQKGEQKLEVISIMAFHLFAYTKPSWINST